MNQDRTYLQRTIVNPKERKRVKIVFVFGVLLLVAALLYAFLYKVDTAPLGSKAFQRFFKDYGSKAQFGLYFCVAIYPVLWIFKQKWMVWKPRLLWIAKLLRQWHTPAGIVGIALVLVHAVLAIASGIKWDFTYISGLIALAVLVTIPITGLLRYRKLDKKWHLILGILFTILFFIHAF